MLHRTPVRQLPLVQQVEEILFERISSGLYPANSQLPAEQTLSAELNVSRATLRSALNALALRGLIVRLHGSGTFVTRTPRIANPLDRAIDFHQLIAASGRKAAIEHVACNLSTANEDMAAALDIEVGSTVVESYRAVTADAEAVIYYANTLPAWLFEEQMLTNILESPQLLEPLYAFLEKNCGQRVEYHYARIKPSTAQACLFHGQIPLPPDTPVLVIDEVAYNTAGQPLFHTYEYHPENRMAFELIRRRE